MMPIACIGFAVGFVFGALFFFVLHELSKDL
jgi:hypothetical protein